jgi:hypothetical protein
MFHFRYFLRIQPSFTNTNADLTSTISITTTTARRRLIDDTTAVVVIGIIIVRPCHSGMIHTPSIDESDEVDVARIHPRCDIPSFFLGAIDPRLLRP